MKNKKKLLIAVAAMGLLAVGTAGIGTAAWYSASEASVSAADTTASITTATSYELEGVVLTVTFSTPSITNLALTDDNGDVWAWNGTSDNLVKAQLGTKVRGVVETITLGLPAGLREDQQAAIAGNYTVTVTKTGSRVKTIAGSSLPAVGTDNYKDATVTFNITIPASGSWSSNNSGTVIVAYDGAQSTAGYAGRDTDALEGSIGVAI